MLLKFVSPPNGNSEFVIADLIRNPRPAWHDLWKAH